MEIHIKIKAQFFKNVNSSEFVNSFFVADGIQKFKLFIDSELLIEDHEKCVTVFKKMLENISTKNQRYEYIDYEIMDPIILSTKEFQKIYDNLSKN
jgi:hypothetical protein